MFEIRIDYDGRYNVLDSYKLEKEFISKYISGNASITKEIAKEYADHIKHFHGGFDEQISKLIIKKLFDLARTNSPEFPELLKIVHAYRLFRIYLLNDEQKQQLFKIAHMNGDTKNFPKIRDILKSMIIGSSFEDYFQLMESNPEYGVLFPNVLKKLSVYDYKQLIEKIDTIYKKYPKIAPAIQEWIHGSQEMDALKRKENSFKTASADLKAKTDKNLINIVVQNSAKNKEGH